MSLINCPECNKQISDKAASCPNCGFPMELIPNSQLKTNGTYTVILLNAFNAKLRVIKYIKEFFGFGLSEAKHWVEAAPQIIIENVSFEKAIDMKKDLCALGAACVIEEYKPNREKDKN